MRLIIQGRGHISTAKQELNRSLRARYKKLFDQIITPVMMITSVFLIASHWKADDDRVFYGLIAIFIIIAFNLSMLMVKTIPTPWGKIPARSDAFDALRWCINFPLDIYVAWSIDPDLVSVVCIWLLLTFGAMTEVYERKYKVISTGAAILSFLVIILFIYPPDLKTQIYVIACYLSVVFILWKLQQYIADEMLRVVQEQVERKQIENEAEALQRDAAIGHSTRAINHELKTLIGVANISTFQIQAKNKSDGISEEIERLNKSLSYMSRVSSLILDGLGSRNASKRIISLKELHDDLKLLLCLDSEYFLDQLHFEFPQDAADYEFEERTGSTYLIIHNLVKNSFDAVSAKYGKDPTGMVRIKAAIENNEIHISVYDNGDGMSDQEIQDIHDQISITTKLDGHGLGLKFVKSECVKNGMDVTIQSVPNEYSLFTIKMPIAKKQEITA